VGYESVSKQAAIVAACTLLSRAAAAQQAESRFNIGAEVTSTWDYNVGISPDDNDKFDVITTGIAVDLRYALVQRQGFEIDASLTPFYNHVSDLNDLSNYGATAGLDLRGEFGPGFTDPWYSISLDYTLARWDDSDPRDGDWVDVELAVGKRFTPKFGISGGYRYHQRWQDDNNPECISGACGRWRTDKVFDHSKNGLFGHVDWFVQDKTSVYFEYSYWDGDVASTGQTGRFGDAVVTDDLAFGGWTRANGDSAEYKVWRADAKTHITEAGINHNFSDHVTVGLSALYLWTSDVSSQASDEDYETARVALTLRYDR
jgi:hypothetical protein